MPHDTILLMVDLQWGKPDPWALWAKSDAGGRPHSLPGHLLDSGAVGELIWDEFLSRKAQRQLDHACGGLGRDVVVLSCSWHDLGKATPAFQLKVPELYEAAVGAGWERPTGSPPPRVSGMKHGASGARIAQTLIGPQSWLLPVISGHHGAFVGARMSDYRGAWQDGPKEGPWSAGQKALALAVAEMLGTDVAAVASVTDSDQQQVPVSLQLAVAGFVSMADWIASSTLFPGLAHEPYDAVVARARARNAWEALHLSGGWRLYGAPAEFGERFGFSPRPLQRAAWEGAGAVESSGLTIIEAPMGEGKTEAALAAVEVISAKTGASGVVFAMPTQGTTDAMYDRVCAWAETVDPNAFPVLLHGKAMANDAWVSALRAVEVQGVCDEDEYGMPLGFGEPVPTSAVGPSEWLMGRHRGLLSPSVVATVDQPLFAATLVKYVALRFAGLIGKVVVIDEVHSYDVFMGEYLHQFLRFCQDLEVPVILMSATLPPAQRQELITAYSEGLTGDGDAVAGRPEILTPGYPAIVTWTPQRGTTTVSVDPRRADMEVQVEMAGASDPDDVGFVAALAAQRSCDGGVLLVILNTVARAQAVYKHLRESSVPVELLHGRLTTASRATRTASLVERLGTAGDRPERLVVVATQIAEQSFDVDADLLITDIAPMDLLLQRIGRLHRHERRDRHAGFECPTTVITGVGQSNPVPHFPYAFEKVYDRYSLLRTASAIRSGPTLRIPSDVPALVAQAYDEESPWPPGWEEAGTVALTEVTSELERRRMEAEQQVLARHRSPNMRDLHRFHDAGAVRGATTVRDGEPTREVALVRRIDGTFFTLDGHSLGVSGERVVGNDALARRVLGDTVRVRESEDLGHCLPLPGWAGAPLVQHVPTLILDVDGQASGPWGSARYDDEIGLVIGRKRR